LNYHKNRLEDQWDRREDPKINPHSYSHLIFDKKAKNIHKKKDSLSSTNSAGKAGYLNAKILKLDPYLSS
jgi:hypothetical protein